jgi:hypothetical protein
MAATTLGGVTLENVSSIDENNEANIEVIPRPRTDSSSALVYDFFGATSTYSISGRFIASSVGALKTKLDAVRAFISGNQASTVTLSSDITGSISVIVNSVVINWNNEAQGKAEYTITVTEGLTPAEVS